MSDGDRRGKRGARTRNADRSEDEKPPRPSAAAGSSGGGIFKSAAVAVLRQHRKLMTTGDITRLAVEMGLLKCQGKTPEATMASALYTDVKRKLHKSLFTRPQEGLFGLREWLDEGYYPEGWVGPPDGLGLAPFKRRNAVGGPQGSVSPSGKAGRGVRTGPGRSSKSKASRSWRNAASDAEDDEDVPLDDDDDDEPPLTGRSAPGSSAAAAAGGGEEDEDDEAMGEAEEAEEEGEEAGEEAADGSAEAHDEHGKQGSGDTGTEAGGAKEAASGMGAGRAQLHPQPSPGLTPGRRGAKGRHGADGGDGAAPQDECLSPLHMLGEAAASESLGDMGLPSDAHGMPPAKRKRPSGITVPERGGGGGGLGGSVDGITPKSPYEDSLAALHEIATSPSTFELTSTRERDREAVSGLGTAARGGAEGGGKAARARPRLHVDVPGHGTEMGAGLGSRRDEGTPGTTLLTDNPMLQGETTPAILLQASPVTTANGQQAMMLRQAPVLVTLPPALASPSAAGGALDTPALLHVQLPGGAPSELMQTTIITPSGAGSLTPLRAQAAAARGGLLKTEGGPGTNRPPGRRVSFSGEVGILGPPSAAGAPGRQTPGPALSALGAGAAGGTGPGHADGAAGAPSWPPRLTHAQMESELGEITRMQTVVERLESKLGSSHPQVGKAWLALARMYQHLGDSERNNGACSRSSMGKAAEALKRAWAACCACAESCGAEVQCEEAYRYLTTRNTDPPLADPPQELKGCSGGQGDVNADRPTAPDVTVAPAQGQAEAASAQEDVVMADAAGDGVPPAANADLAGQSGVQLAPSGVADGQESAKASQMDAQGQQPAVLQVQ